MPHVHPDRPLLPTGKRITRFAIKEIVGRGGYGDVYSAVEVATDAVCAIKIEYFNAENRGLQDEIHILRGLHGQEYFPRLIERGQCDNFHYCVMPLFGPSLSRMRHLLPEKRYSLESVAQLALAMLNCIEALHATGHVHRDVKPGNFLIRSSRRLPVVMIDMGLARSFRDFHTGRHYEYMPRVGFIGTKRYASVHAHKEKRLSRRDDLTSWFYSIVEMAEGKLPWPAHAEQEEIMALKKATTAAELCGELPMQFQEIWRVLRKLKFTDKPNYAWIRGLLKEVIRERRGDEPHKFEWEGMSDEMVQSVSAIPLNMGVALPESEGILYEPTCNDRCTIA
jgi:serine/threonine protein kinase